MTGLIAPTKKVAGIVKDEYGNILPNVHVYYKNAQAEIVGVITNSDGEFWLDQVPGTSVVKFSYQGQDLQKYFAYQVPREVIINITSQLDEVNLDNKKSNLKWWIAGLATVLVIRHVSKKSSTKTKGLGKPTKKNFKEVTI